MWEEWTPIHWLTGFVLLVAGAYWFLMMLLLQGYGYFFDRYVLPVAVFGVVLACVDVDGRTLTLGRLGSASAWAVVVVIGIISTGFTHDYLAWNRTRWTVLRGLTDEAHISPREIDGGYEFNGSLLYDPHHAKSLDKSYWWVVDDAYILASGPLPGYHEVDRQAVSTWLPIGVSAVVTLRRNSL